MNELCDSLASLYTLIVLEGCDGTGKTTLANHLAERHTYQVVHSSRAPDHVDLRERHQRIITAPGRRALDRSYVSELVYGPLFHGRSRLTERHVKELTELVHLRSGVLVHLTADPLHIHGRLRDRSPDDPVDLATIQQILDRYEQVFAQLIVHAPVIRHHS